MSKQKAVEDELIVAALLEHGTVRAAADSLGITPRAIYDRRRDVEFRILYNDALCEVYRASVYEVNRRLGEAVNTVCEIMNDQSAAPAVRLQAARVIIENSSKLADRLKSGEQESRTIRDPFDFMA